MGTGEQMRGELGWAMLKQRFSPHAPEYDFDTLKPLQAGEVAKLVFQFEPSATFFQRGDELKLVLQGKYFISSVKINQPFGYVGNANGRCRVHHDTQYASHLLMPMIQA